MPTNRYKVLVDSHAQYQSESARYELGPFGDYQTAVQATQKIVDDYLLSANRPGMTAEALFASYILFGEDPFIVPDDADPPFSAWTYAKARCRDLCAKGEK
jgi:hypothetical protein